ncbi:ATP-binding protein [Rhabdochromatium marinum]|uniref:ATP-binding protein n=1 Tax=Rhabdochromatium marinum TaxID=48729 RepID=UPI001902C7BD|nr:ATP-binding protein [Rhabdochromatium marinum]MBK1650428.1 hypothetical protein [Rhabdochromatium marinum]
MFAPPAMLILATALALIMVLLVILAIANRRLRATQARLAASEHRWLRALDAAGHGVWDWDTRTDRVFYSRCWKRTLGYDEADIEPRFEEWRCRVHPEDLSVAMENLERHLRGGSAFFSIVHRLRAKDGHYRWILGQGAALERDDQGQVLRMMGTNTDVTAYRQLEPEREQALREAERLAALKNAFLANMSHEIRTPLNAILGLTRMGRRDYDTEAPGPLFRRIDQAGRHLLGLLNDVLDYSKIEAGKLCIAPEPFRLADCLAEVQSIISPQASAKALRLTIESAPDLPEWVQGDALRLRQILINLLGNAVKFTCVGDVCLHIRRLGEPLSFTVTDTGIGMSAEQIERIFQPFEQAERGTARQHGGSGLGLAISQQLARLMGGSLDVDSEPGLGSRFEVRLPLPATEAPARPLTDTHPEHLARRLSGLRVLVVDDIEVNRLVVEDLLSHEGASAISAASGQEALALIQARAASIDAVLMDVQMPEMDGYEATRRLLALRPDLPVIGLTAHALADDRRRSLEAGMLAHLTKPIDSEALVEALLRWRPATLSAAPVEPAPAPAPAPPLNVVVPDAAADRVPAIDWNSLTQRFQQTPNLIERLFAATRATQADIPTALRAAAAAGDLDALFRKAHAIKGLAANLCAHALRDQAHALCERARAGERDALQDAESLASALEHMLEQLKRHADQD